MNLNGLSHDEFQAVRSVLRRCLPDELRLKIALARRAWRDAQQRVVCADRRPGWEGGPIFPHSRYSPPLIHYPGQQRGVTVITLVPVLACARRADARCIV